MATTETRDMLALKVTVDEKGEVWYLNGSCLPRRSGHGVDKFVDTFPFATELTVRSAGTQANANLLTQLYDKRVKGMFSSLEVCSPRCCELQEDRIVPEVFLFSMRKYDAPTSLGGWHEFGLRDFTTYALAGHMFAQPDITQVDDFARSMLFHQPVWPYISFISGINVEACCQLVVTIMDPRWYAEFNGHRMNQFLGLNARTLVSQEDTNRNARCKLVMDCWKNGSGSSKAPTPGNFLWTYWSDKGCGEKGDLLTSRLFVEYMYQTWTMAVCNTPQSNHLFAPELFFKDKLTVESFNNHLRRFAAQNR